MIERAKANSRRRSLSQHGRAHRLWLSAKHRSRQIGVSFDLTVADVRSILSPMTCSLTGVRLTLKPPTKGMHHPRAPSLDRKNTRGGYTRNNVRIVCWQANAALNAFGEKAFAELARAYVSRRA